MANQHTILLVEESNNSLAIFDAEDVSAASRVKLSLWPHEVAVAPDGKTAFVTNFGLRDYDLTIGHAGNSISVIDVASRCEKYRLYTTYKDNRYWAPHGVKVTPDGKHLFVNVERVIGAREPDLTLGPGTDQTNMLVFDLSTRSVVNVFALPTVHGTSNDQTTAEYELPRGSHNFVFSADGSELWLFSGRGGISRLNAKDGEITAHIAEFNGSVRGLSFFPDGRLLVSATNELSIVDPKSLRVVWQKGNLNVTQILYSQPSPKGDIILAPAVWEGQVLAVDARSGKVLKYIATGIDPVHIINSPSGKAAYVTHGRSRWAAEISYDTLSVTRNIPTQGGPNGVAIAAWLPPEPRGRLKFGACLPFTGEFAVEGREMRLGLEFWQDRVNDAGGIFFNGKAHYIDIDYVDTRSTISYERCYEIARGMIGAGAKFMFGSYPSATLRAISDAAGESDIPLISADTQVCSEDILGFQIGPKADNAFIAAVRAICRSVKPKPSSFLLITSKDASKCELAEKAAQYLHDRGFKTVSPPLSDRSFFTIGKDGSVHDCVGLMHEIEPDVVAHFGSKAEAIDLIEAIWERDANPGSVVLDCVVNNSNFMAAGGNKLDNVLGPVLWSELNHNYARDRFVCAEDFGRDYFTEYSERPSCHAAGSAACGVIFQQALVEANSQQHEDVVARIASFVESTFYADVAFDVGGRNQSAGYTVVQLQKGSDQLIEVVIEPRQRGTGDRLIWPFRAT